MRPLRSSSEKNANQEEKRRTKHDPSERREALPHSRRDIVQRRARDVARASCARASRRTNVDLHVRVRADVTRPVVPSPEVPVLR